MMNKNGNNRRRFVILGLLSLLLGLFIYLTYNQDAIISRFIYSCMSIRPQKIPETFIISCIRNWGADFLWMLSFTLFTQVLLNLDKAKHYYLLLCILLGITYEILQYARLAIGTTDVYDILAYTLGNLSAIVIIKLHKEDRNYD